MIQTPVYYSSFWSVGEGVLWWQVALAALAGVALGLLSGYLAARVEILEKLETEENEERGEYEKENEQKRAAAAEKGEPEPQFAPWIAERYGRTWLERWVSPALMAALFAAFVAHQGVSRSTAIHLLWIAVFVHIVAFDLKHRLILNVVTYPTVLLALALSVVTPGLGIKSAAEGAVVCWLFFFIQSVLTRGGIGMGDAKLGAVIGAVCGFDFTSFQFNALYALVAGAFLGGGVAILLLVTRVRGLKDPIPYGPFLCAGAALMLYQTVSL
jgi:hypothetical protein